MNKYMMSLLEKKPKKITLALEESLFIKHRTNIGIYRNKNIKKQITKTKIEKKKKTKTKIKFFNSRKKIDILTH